MSLSNKPLEFITEADLQTLLLDEVSEGKTLEYKQELPGGSDPDKKEFLYDVSSLANASGGDLIFGIKEDGGVPVEICGLDIPDVDATILRLENSIRDGIAPRIPGLRVQPIPLKNKRVVIVFRIPRSFALPHMVTFKNASKFYARNSAGKYQLDVGELRTAFTLSQSITDRIRGFRQERLSNIVAQETPVPMEDGAKLVMHIISIGSFDPASIFDVASLEKQPPQPIGKSMSLNLRHNFDGYLTFEQLGNHPFTRSYLQTFRNGIIEAVKTFGLTLNQSKLINPDYEQEILQALPGFLSVQKNLGVEPPLFIMLSLLGMKGYSIAVDSPFLRALDRTPGNLIERDTLLVPEVIVESFNFDSAQVMKPIFDTVWNAAGFPQSLSYDKNGNWIGRNRFW